MLDTSVVAVSARFGESRGCRVLKELTKVEQGSQAVMAVQVDGVEVTVVAEKFGVSRQTVHAWLRRYEPRPCWFPTAST
jgi:hypothetical protein